MDWSWVGPAIGAVGGYLNSRNNSGNTTTSTQQIPPELQQLLAGVGQRGMEIGNLPYNPYQGNRVADFNPYQLGGFDATAQQASNPWLLQQGQQGLSNFMTGAAQPRSASNPYVSNMDQLAGSLGADVGKAFATTGIKSGSFGNSAVDESAARGIANAVGNLRYQGGEAQASRDQQQQQFNSGQQLSAINSAPGQYQAGFMPGQQLGQIGGQMQQQGQNILNANYDQWQQAQQWPFQTYNAMLGAFGHNTGGTTTQQGPTQSPVAGALGGAMFGNYMQNQWGGNSAQQQSPYSSQQYAAPQYQYGTSGWQPGMTTGNYGGGY